MANKIRIEKNLQDFKILSNILADMDADSNLKFTPDGLVIKMITSSATAMGIFTLSKDFFDEYVIEEELICTVNTILFSKIVNKLGKKDLNIEILETEVKFNSGRSIFYLKYFVANEDERKKPEFDYDCVWTLDSKEFASLIEEHLSFTDYCRFESGEHFKTHIKDNLVKGEIFSHAKCIKTPMDGDKYVRVITSYDVRMMLIVTRIKSLFGSVTIRFAKDFPCNIECEKPNFTFDWLLAPRVENEE